MLPVMDFGIFNRDLGFEGATSWVIGEGFAVLTEFVFLVFFGAGNSFRGSNGEGPIVLPENVGVRIVLGKSPPSRDEEEICKPDDEGAGMVSRTPRYWARLSLYLVGWEESKPGTKAIAGIDERMNIKRMIAALNEFPIGITSIGSGSYFRRRGIK